MRHLRRGAGPALDTSAHKKVFEDASQPGCVTCHSNHRVTHPTDSILGAGPQSVCVTCHVEGDDGFKVAGQLQARLKALDAAITDADGLLNTAEQSGMEVSEVRLEQAQARDALTKARVTLHSVKPDLVSKDLDAGLKIAAKTKEAGQGALAERNHRRVGLAISLLAILAVVIGPRMTILRIEKNA